jgi:hypothetical protein
MRWRQKWWRGLAAAVLGGLVSVTAAVAAGEQFIPMLSIRQGALRFLGIPLTNGFIDYVTLLRILSAAHLLAFARARCSLLHDIEVWYNR